MSGLIEHVVSGTRVHHGPVGRLGGARRSGWITLIMALLVVLVSSDASAGANTAPARDPQVVSVRVGSPNAVAFATEEDRAEMAARMADQILDAGSDHRMSVIKLADVPLQYGSLPANVRRAIQEQAGRGAADHYESAVASLLEETLANIDGQSDGRAVSVLGLPVEAGRGRSDQARQTNSRYSDVIERLDAFSTPRSFMMMRGGRNEDAAVRNAFPEAERLRGSRPILFRTNNTWRMMASEQAPASAGDDQSAGGVAMPSMPSDEFPPQVAALLGEWGMSDSIWDLNGDGTVSHPDLALLLGDPDAYAYLLSVGRWVDVSGAYILGSGQDVAFELLDGAPDNAEIIFQVWSDVTMSVEAAYGDDSAPFVYPGSVLEQVTPGPGELQAIVRDAATDLIVATVTHELIFIEQGDLTITVQNVAAGDPGGGDPGGGDPGGGDPGGGDPGGGDPPDDDPVEWSSYAPGSDSLIIHVSASEGTSGGSGAISDPVRTISAGKSMLRSGHNDFLLLKRGDDWNETFGTWSRSGESAEKPLVISYYGDTSAPRPRLTGSGSTFKPSTTNPPKFVAIIGIHMQPTDTGFDCTNAKIEDFLIEDCHLEGGEKGAQLQASTYDLRTKRVTFRRCIINNNSSMGIYANYHDDLTIEECVLDDNGTSDTHEHNLYIAKGYRTVIRGNLSTRSSNYGIKFRGPHTDGVLDGNIFARNRNGLTIHTKLEGEVNSGIDFVNNVLTENGSDGQMSGVHVSGTQNLKINNNIFNFAHGGQYWNGAAIALGFAQYYDGDGDWPQIEHVEIFNNSFHDYDNHFLIYSDNLPYDDVKIARNVVQRPAPADGYYLVRHRTTMDPADSDYSDNVYHSTNPSGDWFRNGSVHLSFSAWIGASGETGAMSLNVDFADPYRSLAKYNQSLGGENSFEAFITEAKKQRRHNWRPEYTAQAIRAYFEEGLTPSNLPNAPNGGHYGAAPY